ncbi:AAEL005488-PA [Aedes aegypti]|uniref:AAEL005488-PA n=1 Tax=Aedes aegypti TaxID=7159 RepID=Q179W0_AEDAE|nr:AAEL005488-PA [Aedes aegypti]
MLNENPKLVASTVWDNRRAHSTVLNSRPDEPHFLGSFALPTKVVKELTDRKIIEETKKALAQNL